MSAVDPTTVSGRTAHLHRYAYSGYPPCRFSSAISEPEPTTTRPSSSDAKDAWGNVRSRHYSPATQRSRHFLPTAGTYTRCAIRWRRIFSTQANRSTSYKTTLAIETSSRASSMLACRIGGAVRRSAGSSDPGRSRCRSEHRRPLSTSRFRFTIRPALTLPKRQQPRPSCLRLLPSHLLFFWRRVCCDGISRTPSQRRPSADERASP